MIKKYIPLSIKNKIEKILIKIQIAKTKSTHKKEVLKLRNKEKIKVAFFLIYESMWKYEKLYFLLKEDERYEPVVFVCPFISYGEDIANSEMERAYQNFKKKGYTVHKTRNEDQSFIDIKQEFNPDIIFFTNPWNHTLPQYLISNFMDKLTCYTPYGFNSSNLHKVHFQMNMQNYCWKVFTETNFHKELAEKYSPRKGDNFVVTGYPGIDNLIDNQYNPNEVWKKTNKTLKKIIWAPHHTIPGFKKLLDYSTFLDYAEFMLELASEYKEEIQFCFKPHPNLKGKLSDDKIWGKEKTEAYYSQWANMENGQIAEGGYIDLFLTSDAMIHDSGSFLIEYIYTHKPVQFLMSNEEVKSQFNELGKEVFNVIDLAKSKADIRRFIEEVVIKENDNLKHKRDTFYNDFLNLPNNKLASKNIFDELSRDLLKK
ncbi:CDP-glycerol glycerophosphotransferase family protein [Brumimicrobium aurantiacum]|uniref:CDP-glycerol--glycerophosphate glycerophosphotransferase n=1 Tax=Brumimicrobium aurantiacum TaxID=1737063 RepID=A0A3E1F0I8_9FLAO|nr:CDP-glycerol glycerophosphotransferase family protein [Brumimicrobium aurantiacum]RFC55318.1 CDP-glycerol--glycerophosphate glycerophosphotransferase [Brumimicrobium aurantiacum]